MSDCIARWDDRQHPANGTCVWSVIRVYTVSAVSNNRLLTEVDVECIKCGMQKYVVSSGNVLEDGEDIQ